MKKTPIAISESQVRSNYQRVLQRIQEAASRSGRSADLIRLIGVTKYVDAVTAGYLVSAGCLDLGESRPQFIWEKATALSSRNIRWHLIGHLQRNKAKRTLPLISTMHSLDSDRLLSQILEDVVGRESGVELLLEVNISGDAAKTGIAISDAELLLERWMEQNSNNAMAKIVGLMGMGSLNGGADQARNDFESLRKLRDRWSVRYSLPLPELSMGMSDDFEVAIEQGATMVRIGSILFQNDGIIN